MMLQQSRADTEGTASLVAAKQAFLRGFSVQGSSAGGVPPSEYNVAPQSKFKTTYTSGGGAYQAAHAGPSSAAVSMLSGISVLSAHDESSTIVGHSNTDPHMDRDSQSTSSGGLGQQRSLRKSQEAEAVSMLGRSAIPGGGSSGNGSGLMAPEQSRATAARTTSQALASYHAATTQRSLETSKKDAIEDRPMTKEEEELLQRVRAMRSEVHNLTRSFVDTNGMENYLEFFDFSAGSYAVPTTSNRAAKQQEGADPHDISSEPHEVATVLRSKEYRAQRFAAQQSVRKSFMQENDKWLQAKQREYQNKKAAIKKGSAAAMNSEAPVGEDGAPVAPPPLPLPVKLEKMRQDFKSYVKQSREREASLAADRAADAALQRLSWGGKVSVSEKLKVAATPQHQPNGTMATSHHQTANATFPSISADSNSSSSQPPVAAVNPMVLHECMADIVHAKHKEQDDDNFLVDGLRGKSQKEKENAASHLKHIQAQVMLSHVMHAAAVITEEHMQKMMVAAGVQAASGPHSGVASTSGSPFNVLLPNTIQQNSSSDSGIFHTSVTPLNQQAPPGNNLSGGVLASFQQHQQQQFLHSMSLQNQSSMLDPTQGMRANVGDVSVQSRSGSSGFPQSALKGRNTPGGASVHNTHSSSGSGSKKTPTFIGVDPSSDGSGFSPVARHANHPSTNAEQTITVRTGAGLGTTFNADASDGALTSHGSTDDPTHFGFTSRGDIGGPTSHGPGESTIHGDQEDTDVDDDEGGFGSRSPSGARSSSRGSAAGGGQGGGPQPQDATQQSANTTKQSGGILSFVKAKEAAKKKEQEKKKGWLCFRD